jgi:hypothetical protein
MVSNKNSIFHFRDFTKCLQKILQKLSRKFYIFKRIEAVSHILFSPILPSQVIVSCSGDGVGEDMGRDRERDTEQVRDREKISKGDV